MQLELARFVNNCWGVFCEKAYLTYFESKNPQYAYAGPYLCSRGASTRIACEVNTQPTLTNSFNHAHNTPNSSELNRFTLRFYLSFCDKSCAIWQ